MFDALTTTRITLENLAGEFDPDAISGDDAVRAVTVLGVIHRLTEGLLAKAARRVADTSAYVPSGDCDAAQFYARTVGVGAGEAHRVLGMAKRLEALPETAAAVREGRLSGRQAQLVAGAAARNPRAERELLAAASEGMVPLRDACVIARAEVEDPEKRRARHRRARRWRMWTAEDGMVEGHFRLEPEVGGPCKAVLDAEVQRIFRARRLSGEHESHEAYAADAFASFILDSRERGARRAATNVHVVIDHAALVRGNAVAGERCEIPGIGPVDAQWVREQLGEAFLTAVIKKGRDIRTVAHLGRHVPAVVRTAMIVGGRECEVAGCARRGYLERDHCVTDFAKGGPTARWNLAWLCSVHHKRKTKGWRLGRPDPRTGKRTLRQPVARASPVAA
jgi:5-methylcytosine-specific restriction endonuclease McrA